MRRTLFLLAFVGALVLAPAAAWGSGVDVIRDCTDNGRIDDQHGPQDYADALSSLPSDVDEYTDCRQVISDARRNPPQSSSGGGGGGDGVDGGGGGGGGDRSSGGGGGDDRGAVAGASARRRAVPQGPPVIPPASDLASKPVDSGLPLPLIIAVALIALGALAWLLAALRGHKPSVTLGRVFHRVFPRRA